MDHAHAPTSSPSAPATTGRLAPEELRSLVAAGTIDTILLASVDMQGRLQGKRLGAHYFLAEVLDHGAGTCSYLLSLEVEIAPQEGLSTSSWETGHGDFHLIPDLSTLRLASWRPRTAICLADPVWPGGDPVAPSPRQVLRRQLERLAERGWTARAATELEFIVHRESYSEARECGYQGLTPASEYNSDYSRALARLPTELGAALTLFRESEMACATFGQDIVDHYARAAEIELEAYRATVSDRERIRGDERL